MNDKSINILQAVPDVDGIWSDTHKIPWNDPAFSGRMLKEHLSQDHHLASRKADVVREQAQWAGSIRLSSATDSILDLGCGPGLYSRRLAGETRRYLGIDFSPASIAYADKTYAESGRIEFVLGDVTKAAFAGPHGMVVMLYGELNVFSPENCRRIVAKAYACLAPGGRFLVEFQNPDFVRKAGEAPRSWTRAEKGGLFSDAPYVCLTENHWFENRSLAVQRFHVVEPNGAELKTYQSVTRAWSLEEIHTLFHGAGFSDVRLHDDWPVQDDSLFLVSAVCA